MAAPNRMNFRKSSNRGGVIFNPKVCVAYFGNFKQGFYSMKLIQKGMKYMHMISSKRDHSKGQGVGVKGRLELSRKFICFGTVTHPLH